MTDTNGNIPAKNYVRMTEAEIIIRSQDDMDSAIDCWRALSPPKDLVDEAAPIALSILSSVYRAHNEYMVDVAGIENAHQIAHLVLNNVAWTLAVRKGFKF